MKIPNQLTRLIGRQILVARKHSPHILFGAGVVGVVTSTVLACRATLKLEKTLDSVAEEISHSKAVLVHHDSNVTEIQQRPVAVSYIAGGYRVAKLYAPAVLIGSASIAALTGSHVVLTRRYAAVTAAYSAVSVAFEDYRERVRKEVGEKREIELYRGAELEKIQDVDGKATFAIEPGKGSPYMQLFAEHNKHWKKSAEHNFNFILGQQNYANHLLKSRGHIFLQEVYDMLGFERTPAAQVVGWIYLSDTGDDYVDFGLFEARNKSFVNQVERSIWLDFNVDGIIYDKI